MIRFFRQIRLRLMSEKRITRYLFYAIGEILLVVIGILIALYVNNLNQERLHRKKEILLLKEIHSEFLFNRSEMENTLNHYDRAKSNVQKIISLFPIQVNDVDLDSLSSYFEGITFNPSFDVSRGSIENLKYASSFEIISNEELRTLLLRFDDLMEDYADRESRSKNFSLDYLDPFLRLHLPSPFYEGIKEPNINLDFLATVEFENLIKARLHKIQNFTQILEDSDRPLVRSIDRIIELSAVN